MFCDWKCLSVWNSRCWIWWWLILGYRMKLKVVLICVVNYVRSFCNCLFCFWLCGIVKLMLFLVCDWVLMIILLRILVCFIFLFELLFCFVGWMLCVILVRFWIVCDVMNWSWIWIVFMLVGNDNCWILFWLNFGLYMFLYNVLVMLNFVIN